MQTGTGSLDPQVANLLSELAKLNLPALEAQTPEQARKANALSKQKLCGPLLPVARLWDVTIAGPGGRLPLRIYHPYERGAYPVLVYFHGGGWVLGDLDTHDPLCRALAHAADCVVVAVDYRLAPEHPFPAAVDDAEASVRWAAQHIQEFGGDPHRLAVGGDSAGGTLATVAARRLRDDPTIALAHQGLIYPVTDLTTLDTESYHRFAEGYFLTRAAMAWFRNHYLPKPEHAALPDASPLRRDDLGGLPPAFTLTAEFDPLRDEGEAYAAKLRDAGVAVTCVRAPGMVHGYLTLANAIDQAAEGIRTWASALKRAFDATPESTPKAT